VVVDWRKGARGAVARAETSDNTKSFVVEVDWALGAKFGFDDSTSGDVLQHHEECGWRQLCGLIIPLAETETTSSNSTSLNWKLMRKVVGQTDELWPIRVRHDGDSNASSTCVHKPWTVEIRRLFPGGVERDSTMIVAHKHGG
jgi:hypothetical protein